MRLNYKILLANLPILASCTGSEPTTHNAEVVRVEQSAPKCKEAIPNSSSTSSTVTSGGTTNLDAEAKSKEYMKSYGYDFEQMVGNMRDQEWEETTIFLSELYDRDLKRKTSADEYYQYLSQYMPSEMDSKNPERLHDRTNYQMRKFGYYELSNLYRIDYVDSKQPQTFDIINYDNPHFTSISKVGDYYVATYWMPLDCEQVFGVLTFDNEIRRIDHLQYRFMSCIDIDYESLSPEAYERDTFDRIVVAPDLEAPNNPIVSVSEFGEVKRVEPIEYYVTNLDTDSIFTYIDRTTTEYVLDDNGKFKVVKDNGLKSKKEIAEMYNAK